MLKKKKVLIDILKKKRACGDLCSKFTSTTISRALFGACSNLILLTLQSKKDRYCYPHYTDEETEAHKG